MRILFINTFYYPNMQGGAEQSVKLLAEGLSKKGHQVAVYSGDSKDGYNHIEIINGVKLYRFTTGKFNLFRFSYEKHKVGPVEKVLQKFRTYYNPSVTKEFKVVCSHFKPDAIHTNTLYGLPYTLWKTAAQLGIPVVHTIRDTAIVSPVQHGHKVSWLIEKIHRSYMRHYSNYVHAVTAPSDYTLSSSLKTGSFKHAAVKQCIVNSVDLDLAELLNVVEKKRGRSSSRIKFMYAGRLVEIKGIRHMIEAFEQMTHTDCELFICGGGEMQSYVEDKANAEPRIIYCGKLNNEQLAEKYAECDVLLVPSNWPEPFGRVVIEGNQYGMPVIAARCGGIPEIINVIQGGELYQPGESRDLADLMDRFMDRGVYQNYWNAIQKNIEVYGVDKQVAVFQRLYEKIRK